MSPAKKHIPTLTDSQWKPTSEEITSMVAEAAYYKAEHRGFNGGNPENDWWEAEREIEAMLAAPRAGRTAKRGRASKSPAR